MTDKEKRELKDGVISIFKRFNILDHTATIRELRDDILRYIDSLQEEPVSEKKCMFTNDIYTDEDRKVLCEDCKEKCEYSKKEEPVNEDLEQAIDNYLATYWGGEKEKQDWPFLKKMAIHFANWQKGQMMKDAVDGVIADRWADQKLSIDIQPVDTYSYNLYDKVKLIIIKQEEE